jgi:hypothetical protein
VPGRITSIFAEFEYPFEFTGGLFMFELFDASPPHEITASAVPNISNIDQIFTRPIISVDSQLRKKPG